MKDWDFPGDPVVGTQCFHCRESPDSVPGGGTKILQTMWHGKK